MTTDGIKGMLKELSEHKRPKEQLKAIFIQERLNKSIKSYYHELNNSYEALKCRNDVQIMRKLNKDKI